MSRSRLNERAGLSRPPARGTIPWSDRSQARSVRRGKSCAKTAGVHSSGCKISSLHARRTLQNDQGKMRTRIHFGRAQQGPHRSPCSAPCPSSPLHSWGLACTAFTNGSDSTNALRMVAHSHTACARGRFGFAECPSFEKIVPPGTRTSIESVPIYRAFDFHATNSPDRIGSNLLGF